MAQALFALALPPRARAPSTNPALSSPFLTTTAGGSSSSSSSFYARTFSLTSFTEFAARRNSRRLIVRAGRPSRNSLILAFVLPFSLLVGTIFTASRIADRLDEKYLEEIARNKAIMEEKEADETAREVDDDGNQEEKMAEEAGDGNVLIKTSEEVAAAAPRVRNRPKRRA